MKREYEYIIVGSGAGGATLAKELGQRGKDIAVIEKGPFLDKMSMLRHAFKYYDRKGIFKAPIKSKEGVILYHSLCAGGTTLVSLGNAFRASEEELANHDIHLGKEYQEAERQMHVSPLKEELWGLRACKLKKAADEIGYHMKPVRKYMEPKKCKKCGFCMIGCPGDGRWTALDFLEKVVCNDNVHIIDNAEVVKVIIEGGNTKGIRYVVGPEKKEREFFANTVILSAGGLGTPVILLNSGIREAGRNLFVDPFVNVYGVTSDVGIMNEIPMASVYHSPGPDKKFIISPYIIPHKMARLVEFGVKSVFKPLNKILGLMVKIADESSGYVGSDGLISKPITEKDRLTFDEGLSIAKEILIKAGVERSSIMVSKPAGAHPGGTAAIGKVVNRDLMTQIKGLYVCDASVFPGTSGLPPILTIVALAKRLARNLT